MKRGIHGKCVIVRYTEWQHEENAKTIKSAKTVTMAKNFFIL